MRLALITNIPAPYRLPVWEVLAQKAGYLHVFLCAENEPNRIWETFPLNDFSFAHTFLPGLHFFIPRFDWGININPSLWKELNQYKPSNIIIGGYESPTYLIGLLYAKTHGIPVTIWWESHALSSRFSGGPILWLKRWIMKNFDSFCAVSYLAKIYLIEQIGIPENKISRATNSVDPNRWHSLTALEQNIRSVELPVRFLYVGQFIKRKGVLELLEAFKDIPISKGILRLVGYGSQESIIRDFIIQHNMNNVELAGATKSMEQTAEFYRWTDVLIMPSLIEVWGLVVNEALACGVYIMASKFAGVTHDLIDHAPYDVGVSFDPTDKDNFRTVLLDVIEKHKIFNRRAISGWGLTKTPEIYAEDVLKAALLAKRAPN